MISLINTRSHWTDVIEQNHFPDGTLHINMPPNYFDYDTVLWEYENDAELFTLICVKGHFKDCPLRLDMPYIPHARMDRVQELEDVFTLKYFCQVINGLHFDKVIVRDAHSNVALALLDRVIDLTPIGEIKEAIKLFEHYEKETPVLFFPDEGAMKRYSTPAINLPYAFGIKKRDWSTGKILGLQLMNGELVKDKGVLIVDDICSRGGTFYHAANALKEAGAKNIYLYVTHAEHTMVEGDMYNQDIVKKIFTTDSIFKPEWDTRGKVEIAAAAGIDLLKANRGAIMKYVSAALKGKADMKIVSTVVGEILK